METGKTLKGRTGGLEGDSPRSSEALLEIESRHLRAVAKVHQRAFPDSALTRLGCEAVRRYYEWQMTGPHEHRFVGVFKGDELQGFAVGGKSRGALSGFVRRNKYYLVYRMLLTPVVLVTPQGRKAFRSALRVFRRGSGKKTVKPSAASGPPSFGILAIAVAPAFQGKGVGKVLMEEMESVARARGYGRMHLTVSVNNLQAIGFYEKLGWLKSSGDSRWAGGMVKSLV